MASTQRPTVNLAKLVVSSFLRVVVTINKRSCLRRHIIGPVSIWPMLCLSRRSVLNTIAIVVIDTSLASVGKKYGIRFCFHIRSFFGACFGIIPRASQQSYWALFSSPKNQKGFKISHYNQSCGTCIKH
jgi:hypothetical protein